MAGHPDPEIMRLSLSDLALRIKIMKVNLGTSIEDVLSRALDPPLGINVQRAVSSLVEVCSLLCAYIRAFVLPPSRSEHSRRARRSRPWVDC